MFRTLTAALLALALALPGAAQAQQAKGNDKAVIGTIAGVAALAVIAHQLSKKDKKNDHHHVAPPPPSPPAWDHGRDHGPGKGKGPDRGNGWGKPQATLPAACLTDLRDTRGNRHQILGKTCLNKSHADVRRLPDRCEVSIRTRQGTQHGFSASCLQQQGYRIARR